MSSHIQRSIHRDNKYLTNKTIINNKYLKWWNILMKKNMIDHNSIIDSWKKWMFYNKTIFNLKDNYIEKLRQLNNTWYTPWKKNNTLSKFLYNFLAEKWIQFVSIECSSCSIISSLIWHCDGCGIMSFPLTIGSFIC